MALRRRLAWHGPIIFGSTPSKWIGDPGEIPVAVPDAFFKIVVKASETEAVPDVLAFILPMEGIGNYSSGRAVHRVHSAGARPILAGNLLIPDSPIAPELG